MKRSTREQARRGRLQWGMAPDQKISKDNDDGRLDDKRGDRTAPKEGVLVLSMEQENLKGPKKAERCAAPSNSEYK